MYNHIDADCVYFNNVNGSKDTGRGRGDAIKVKERVLRGSSTNQPTNVHNDAASPTRYLRVWVPSLRPMILPFARRI